VEALCGEALRSPSDLCHLYRVTVEPGPSGPVARLTGHQGSGLVSGLGLADGLAVVPEGVERLDVGAPVQVILLDDGPEGRGDPGYRPRETGKA
jgi:molybdopterin biosynthesis enzyme